MSSLNETLIVAVLQQLDGKLDYNVLARAIGAPSRQAAYERWKRVHNKLKKAAGHGFAQPAGVQKPVQSPTKTKGGKVLRAKNEMGDASSTQEDEEMLPVTPIRKLPARKARVTSFAVYASESEDHDEVDEEDGVGFGDEMADNVNAKDERNKA